MGHLSQASQVGYSHINDGPEMFFHQRHIEAVSTVKVGEAVIPVTEEVAQGL